MDPFDPWTLGAIRPWPIGTLLGPGPLGNGPLSPGPLGNGPVCRCGSFQWGLRPIGPRPITQVPAWEGEPLSRPPIMEAHAGQLGLVPLIGPGQLCSGPTGTGPLGLRQVGLGPFGPGPWARAHYRRGRPGCYGHRYFSEHSVTQIIHIRIVSRRRGQCLATASHK